MVHSTSIHFCVRKKRELIPPLDVILGKMGKVLKRNPLAHQSLTNLEIVSLNKEVK